MWRVVGMRVLAVTAGAVLLVGCGKNDHQIKLPPAAVTFVTIREQPVSVSADLPGRTSPFAVSEIRPQVSGIIQKRLFVEGSTVKAGQPLYQIDPAPYRAAYEKAHAVLAGAEGRAQRYAALVRSNAIAPQTNDDAQATLLQARADMDMARINLNYTRILAPIGGRIGASSVTQGALVTAQQTQPLATISTLDPIYVDIDQSSAELLALKRAVAAGQMNETSPDSAPVHLTLDDGVDYPLEGKLQFTDVMVDPGTGAVRLRAIFPNPNGVLLPGLHVRARVRQGVDPHGILAPQHGISRNEQGEAIAYVVNSQNIARLRVLKTGHAVGRSWQVLEGLKPGDRMIVEGLQKVRADMPVTPTPAATGEK